MFEQKKYSYQELQGLFESKYIMPPLEDYQIKDEVVYRCPYMSDCPGKYECFVVSSPEPIGSNVKLYIRCKLCKDKIPIYATHMKWEKRTEYYKLLASHLDAHCRI